MDRKYDVFFNRLKSSPSTHNNQNEPCKFCILRKVSGFVPLSDWLWPQYHFIGDYKTFLDICSPVCFIRVK